MSEEVPLAPHVPICLGFIAGMVDVTGWLTLGGLFTAHITGNLVVIAADAVEGRPLHAAQVLAIPMFIAVAAAVAVAVKLLGLSAARMERLLLALQALLLLVAALVAVSTSPSHAPSGWNAGVVAMFAVAAMASQNALLHLSRKPTPTTAVMTGNIVQGTLSLVAMAMATGPDRAAARAQWQQAWPLVLGFLAGCGAGAVSVSLFRDTAWLVLALAAQAIGLWGRRTRRCGIEAHDANRLYGAPPLPTSLRQREISDRSRTGRRRWLSRDAGGRPRSNEANARRYEWAFSSVAGSCGDASDQESAGRSRPGKNPSESNGSGHRPRY